MINNELEKVLLSICGVSSSRKIEMKAFFDDTGNKGLAIFKNSILYDLFRNITERFFEAGILQHSYKLNLEQAFPVPPEEIEDTRRILSLSDLGFGFEIWLFACGISCSVFMLEIFSVLLPYAKNSLSSYIGLVILIKWLKNRY